MEKPMARKATVKASRRITSLDLYFDGNSDWFLSGMAAVNLLIHFSSSSGSDSGSNVVNVYKYREKE